MLEVERNEASGRWYVHGFIGDDRELEMVASVLDARMEKLTVGDERQFFLVTSNHDAYNHKHNAPHFTTDVKIGSWVSLFTSTWDEGDESGRVRDVAPATDGASGS